MPHPPRIPSAAVVKGAWKTNTHARSSIDVFCYFFALKYRPPSTSPSPPQSAPPPSSPPPSPPLPLNLSHLGEHSLEQLSHRHAGGQCVWVDDDVRADAQGPASPPAAAPIARQLSGTASAVPCCSRPGGRLRSTGSAFCRRDLR